MVWGQTSTDSRLTVDYFVALYTIVHTTEVHNIRARARSSV